MKEKIISFESGGSRLEGVLRIPGRMMGRAAPCVLLIHGSLEHGRDGNMLHARDHRKNQPYKEEYFLAMTDYMNRHIGGAP